MSQYSDSESNDSEEGIRFKTDSVRSKQNKNLSSNRSRSRSPRARRKRDESSPEATVGPHSSKSREETASFGPQLPPPVLNKQSKMEESSRIGPQLPPHCTKKEEASIGPQLPKKAEADAPYIGPQLPPHLTKDEPEPSSIGPRLPPHLLKKEEVQEPPSSCIGPQLPPQLRQKLAEAVVEEESDDEEDVYGPLPADAANLTKAQIALEERALQIKMDQLEPDKEKLPVREEWMLELPEVKAARFGLGPRQFRSKQGPDFSDRSSWTDTPEEKKKKKKEKVDLKKEAELKEIRKRDQEQEKIAKKLKKKNKESLLEMHQSKMKNKKEEEPTERRPFSRDIDLQVNRFDEAQKKAVLKKAQLLDDRFSSGQSKFL